jgi:hypothetical protein
VRSTADRVRSWCEQSYECKRAMGNAKDHSAPTAGRPTGQGCKRSSVGETVGHTRQAAGAALEAQVRGRRGCATHHLGAYRRREVEWRVITAARGLHTEIQEQCEDSPVAVNLLSCLGRGGGNEGGKSMNKFLLATAVMVALFTPTFTAAPSAYGKSKLRPPDRTCKQVKKWGHRYILRCPGQGSQSLIRGAAMMDDRTPEQILAD